MSRRYHWYKFKEIAPKVEVENERGNPKQCQLKVSIKWKSSLKYYLFPNILMKVSKPYEPAAKTYFQTCFN